MLRGSVRRYGRTSPKTFALVLLGGILTSACGNGAPLKSTTSASSTETQSSGVIKGSGPVDVLYAGSLVGAVTKVIGPAFDRATGFTLEGLPGGASALANEIKDRIEVADVFISASPKVDATLEGSANGNWVNWYLYLAKAPLLIGYNPNSTFATQLKKRPWYQVMAERGFLLGRTDPKLDPKGVLTIKLVKEEAAKLHDPGLVTQILGSTENPAQVFPEETLVSRLEAGQLDAGFFYSNEAALAKIPTISTGIDLGATFTVALVKGAPHMRGAESFIKYLYSKEGQSLLKKVGLTLVAPKLSGPIDRVPPLLRPIIK